MPARSIVTRENLGRDFVIDPSKATGGALRLNLNPSHFARHPITGLISVVGGGGGGGEVVISDDPGNIIEMREDGLYAASTVAVSAESGNVISVQPDGIYVSREAISARPGNMVSRLTGTGVAGLYVGAPGVYETGADYVVRPQETNMLVLLTNGADTVEVPTGGILAFAEFTLLKTNGPFTVAFPEGVSGNGIDGPCSFTVQALPNGVVLKCLAADSWLLLGDAVLVE